MKTRLFTLVALFVLGTVTCFAAIKGNGKVITKNIDVTDYKSLSLGGSIKNGSWFGSNDNESPVCFYSQTTGSATLSITLDENLFSYLDIKSGGNKLSVRVRNNTTIAPTKLVVKCSSSKLENLQVSGCFDFKSETSLSGTTLNIGASGASDVKIKHAVRVDNCSLSSSGASDLELKDLKCSDIKAYDFKVGKLSCGSSGSSDIKVYVTESLEASASGSSDIKYKGNPSVKRSVSGSADVDNVK
ncbi:MAG: hypothetical protein PARBA_03798 [Parabacteroides sp.]